MKSCANCNGTLGKGQFKYCSNSCQLDFQHKKYIEEWKKGEADGNRGVRVKNISEYVRTYLVKKFGQHCAKCGWDEKNVVTNKVPLEIDHIDGNSNNNEEDNLRLICPNCHALTANFRNLNKGSGRSWRRKKYTRFADSA